MRFLSHVTAMFVVLGFAVVFATACGNDSNGNKNDIRTDLPAEVEDLGPELDVPREDHKEETVDIRDEESPELPDIKEADEAGTTEDEDIPIFEEEYIAPICTMPCQDHADCADSFPEVTVCEKAVCQVDPGCTEDEDEENDKQCKLIKDPDKPDCCVVDEACIDDSVCTCNEQCVDNECVTEVCDPLPEECNANLVLKNINFDNMVVGNPLPACNGDPICASDFPLDDKVFWQVVNGPCGSPAAWLGDIDTKTYYTGQTVEVDGQWIIVERIECTDDNEDQVCPEPMENCVNGFCEPDPPADKVDGSLFVPEVNLPPDTLLRLTFSLWMDAEDSPDFMGTTFDRLKVFADTVDGPQELWTSHVLVENGTEGMCIHVAASLSDWAGESVDLRWNFNTADGTNNIYEGVYIDDIKVSTYVDTEKCNNDEACDDSNVCTKDKCVDLWYKADTTIGGVCFHAPIPWCVECETAIDDCADLGPFPEDQECYPPVCVKENPDDVKGLCDWSPNPDCCEENKLATHFPEEGFEGGELPDGFVVEPQPIDDPIIWTVVDGYGAPENGNDPDADTFGIYFGKPGLDTYDCGLDQCFGAFTTAPVDLTGYYVNSQVKLTFQLKMGTEWDGEDPEGYLPEQIDVLTVTAINAAGEKKQVWSSDYIFGTTDGQYLPMWADLEFLAGQKGYLVFKFDTGDVLPPKNDFFGVAIDEITVETVCEEICVMDGDCTVGGACATGECTDGQCAYEAIEDCCVTEDDPACDDGDVCTDDYCNVETNKCGHDFSEDPACCSPYDGVFIENFSDTPFDPLQEQPGVDFWTVPIVDSNTCNGLFPICEEDVETCYVCPGECGQCPISWHQVDQDCFSDGGCFYFGNPVTMSYHNGVEPAWGVITSPAFQMPPYGIPKAEFMLKLCTEHCGTFNTFVEPNDYDILRLHVSHAQALDSPLWSDKQEVWNSMSWDVKGCTYSQNQQACVWLPIKVGMEDMDLEGKALRFTFEFDSFDGSSNDFEGVHVDDFKVGTLCEPPDHQCFSAYECPETNPGDANCSIETCVAGVCGSIPNPLMEGCCNQEVVALYDYDGPCSTEGWVATPPMDPVMWQSVDCSTNPCGECKSGKCSLYFGNKQTCKYGPGWKIGSAQSPAIDVTGYDQVEVSFWMWLDLEDPFYFLDKYKLEMDQYWTVIGDAMGFPITLIEKPCDQTLDCNAGVPDNCLDLGCETLEMQQWVYHSMVVDLAAYDWVPGLTPKEAIFTFKFDSGDAVNWDGKGIFIDDFAVKSLCQ